MKMTWENKSREMLHIQSMFRTDAEYNKAIREIYQRAENQITKEINSELVKFASKENLSMDIAREKIKKFDVEAFGAKAKQYIEDGNLTQRAREELRTYNVTMRSNRLEMLKANLQLETVKAADEEGKLLYSRLDEELYNEVKRQAGILGTTVPSRADLERRAKAIVGSDFKGTKFSNRIWQSQSDLQRELEKAIERTLIQGKNPTVGLKDLTNAVQKSVKNRRFAAERLAVTESARVQTGSQKLSFERFDIRRYEFVAETDDRTCEVCEELNGRIFNVVDMEPGLNAAPMHAFCRCSTAGVGDAETVGKEAERNV